MSGSESTPGWPGRQPTPFRQACDATAATLVGLIETHCLFLVHLPLVIRRFYSLLSLLTSFDCLGLPNLSSPTSTI